MNADSCLDVELYRKSAGRRLPATAGDSGDVRSLSVRPRFGTRFGRRSEKLFAVFDFLTPNRPLHRAENPRVDGSIPSLATIPNFLIVMRFLA